MIGIEFLAAEPVASDGLQLLDPILTLSTPTVSAFIQPARITAVDARNLLDQISNKSAEDWLLYARALEFEADQPQVTIAERQQYKIRAAEIRVKYDFSLEYDFGE